MVEQLACQIQMWLVSSGALMHVPLRVLVVILSRLWWLSPVPKSDVNYRVIHVQALWLW